MGDLRDGAFLPDDPMWEGGEVVALEDAEKEIDVLRIALDNLLKSMHCDADQPDSEFMPPTLAAVEQARRALGKENR